MGRGGTGCGGTAGGYRATSSIPTRDDGAVKVSTRGDYAARALLSLALHDSSTPTSVKEIAERTSLPQPYLEQILLAVKGAGLVRSKRGVGGGYLLARPADQITLASIVAAVDGPLTTDTDEHDHCEGHCILQEVWVGVSDELRLALEQVTLAELVGRTRSGHRVAEAAAPRDRDRAKGLRP
jgi:Rrf2 family transcriptional regulator, iron-sulfur cluster assembly transcription factor